MATGRLGAEQIVTKLRQFEVLQGKARVSPRGLQGSGNDGADTLPMA